MRKLMFNDIASVAARVGAFKPTPQAGVFHPSDLAILRQAQVRAKAMQAAYESREPKVTEARETIDNTNRYWQSPGTSTLHGGDRDRS